MFTLLNRVNISEGGKLWLANYSVHYDPEHMQEICDRSPYNLKKEIKDISKDELHRIAEEIGHALRQGLDRPKLTPVLHWDSLHRVGWAKIRVVDIMNDAGKSSGYRCLVLADTKNKHAFLLHIYKHGSPKDDNIDRSTKNKLNHLVDEYASSL